MIALRPFVRRLASCKRGTTLIETAILAPVLIMMSIGAFEISRMVARQSELQSSAEQATEIALAVVPDTPQERAAIKAKLMESSGLGAARVDVDPKYRCGSGAVVSAPPTCSDDSLNSYIFISLSDEYQPVWTEWGFAQSFEYHVTRTVQIS